MLYGRVAECKENDDGRVIKCKVVYSAQSRNDVNLTSSDCATDVPKSQWWPLPLILGACISWEQEIGVADKASLAKQLGMEHNCLKWIVPTCRLGKQVKNGDGRLLPRLSLNFRGFRLELSVEPSTKEGAGDGVFLRCSPLLPEDDGAEAEPLVLKAGELIDLGIYGPFRIQDKKPEPVFFAKNFLHSHESEVWAHQAGDSRYQVDVTDDVTGQIHEVAKEHIHAYVNETDALGAVSIRAEHDPEGCVHYLLGHSHQSKGNLVVPSDSSPLEVYVNYGTGYEKVRLRKGYSFLPDGEEKDVLLKEIQDDDFTDVEEMLKFSAAEVEAVIDFLVGLFAQEKGFANNVIKRALTVSAILQRRARQLFLKQNADEVSTTTDMRTVFNDSGDLVSLLLKMINDKKGLELQANRKIDMVLKRVLQKYMEFSDDEVAELTK